MSGLTQRHGGGRATRPNAIREHCTRWLVGISLAVVLLALLPGMAEASLSWSSPRAVDPEASGVALNRVACPSLTQCTAGDVNGHAVTFNPQSPRSLTTAIVSTHGISGLACPSTTQCTAIDVNGGATTFDPQSSAGGTPTEIDSSAIPLGLACPSTTQCSLVDLQGREDTFNPQALGSAPAPTMLDPNQLLLSVSCPGGSTTWCIAVATSGVVIGFNPGGGAQPPVQIDTVQGASVQAASCSPKPSSKQCALVDNAANAFAFTAPPNSPPVRGSQGSAETGPNAAVPTALACPDDTTCVAVDQHGGEATFDPQLPIAAPAPVDPGQVLSDVACPSASQCTSVDRNGNEVTFNPASPGSPSRAPVDGHTSLVSVACPSIGQCTAIDVGGSEVTFAPGSSAAPTTAVVDPSASGLYGVACPMTTQCSVVDNRGAEVTFNPGSPGSPRPTQLAGGHALNGISCPAAAQCTTVDDVGQEVTFNPQAPGKPNPATVDSGHALLAVSCPSSTRCSAVDDRGAEVSFNPLSPGRPVAHLIDRVPADALTCPTTAQCTAVDGAGDEVTFDPDAPGKASALAVDPSGQLAAIACRTETDCVALDQSGRAVEGDPRGTGAWASHTLGQDSLTGAVCPTPRECVAIDQPGDAFVGSSGPLPPVPGGLSSPAGTGLVQQGQTLAVRHGRWSHAPTSYTYRWERCNAKGKRCRRIAGAAASRYRLTHADVGHRIRVQESAWNITGAGTPRLSRATGIAGGLVSLNSTLSGISTGAPRLVFSLRARRGTTPLTRVLAALPSGLTLRGIRGLVVTASGKGLSHAVTARKRSLMISLRKAAAGVVVVIPSQDLRVGGRLRRVLRSHQQNNLIFSVTAIQRDRGRTLEKSRLAPR
jgi:hypothetical protein